MWMEPGHGGRNRSDFYRRAVVWNLAAVAGVTSAAASLSGPARTGLVHSIVAAEQLNEANALNQLARHLVLTVGPAIGGTIVAVAGCRLWRWLQCRLLVRLGGVDGENPCPAR
jgi:hypothetical protein